MLDDVGLVRLDQQTFYQFLLGFLQALVLLQQAGALVDQSDPCLVRLQSRRRERRSPP